MIEQPPLLRIRREIPRPPAEWLAALRDVPTGNVVDAMLGRGALDPRVQPVLGTEPRFCRFVGTAVTCFCGPDDNLALLAALSVAAPGDVLVAATEGFVHGAVCGDILAGMAKNRGVVGIVTDGAVRDRAGLREVGLPVFAAAVTPNSAAKSGPGTVGLPVVVGGVRVSAGDILVADEDGVVVVPRTQTEAVIARLRMVREAERQLLDQVARGLDLPASVAQLLASDRVEDVKGEEP